MCFTKVMFQPIHFSVPRALYRKSQQVPKKTTHNQTNNTPQLRFFFYKQYFRPKVNLPTYHLDTPEQQVPSKFNCFSEDFVCFIFSTYPNPPPATVCPSSFLLSHRWLKTGKMKTSHRVPNLPPSAPLKERAVGVWA